MKSRYFLPNVIVKKIILGKKYLLFFKYNLIIFPFKRSCIVKEKRIAILLRSCNSSFVQK